jgi:polysaccharide biosynthesis/export protein
MKNICEEAYKIDKYMISIRLRNVCTNDDLRIVMSVFFVLVMVPFTACLRFFPSRTNNNVQGNHYIGGKEEFIAFEKNQAEALQSLMKSRKKILENSNANVYLIGIGDQIEIRVFDVAELNTVVRVRPDGKITLPLIGDLVVYNITEAELHSLIYKKLVKYVKNPQVSTNILNFEAHKVSVIGEVVKPGAYPLKKFKYTLVELLSEAGGRTIRASNKVLISPANSMNAAVEVDIEDMLGALGKAPLQIPLQDGDTIVIPESGQVDVDGEVEKPGSYPLSAKTTILGAIASAGGLTYSADINQVEIIRDTGGGKKAGMSINIEKIALEGAQDIRLRNGDIIRVPSAKGRFAARQVVQVINKLFSGISGNVTSNR